jgi:predicted RNase H-like nuclease
MERQDLAQMMKQMLARMDGIKEMKEEMKTMQEKADANMKPMREDMKANQEKADAQQAKMEANMESMNVCMYV